MGAHFLGCHIVIGTDVISSVAANTLKYYGDVCFTALFDNTVYFVLEIKAASEYDCAVKITEVRQSEYIKFSGSVGCRIDICRITGKQE